uniref:Uncharacterized protein n=1 Tax=Glossina brevipalpis TaxID=37001 RepID=A0A1A9WC90_9MUSC
MSRNIKCSYYPHQIISNKRIVVVVVVVVIVVVVVAFASFSRCLCKQRTPYSLLFVKSNLSQALCTKV